MKDGTALELTKAAALLTVGGAVAWHYFPAETLSLLRLAGPLTLGAALFLRDTSSIEVQLQRAFEACRLGVPDLDNKKKVSWPKRIKKIEKEYGWRLIYSIPKGLCIGQFLERQLELQTAMNCEMELWQEQNLLHIRLLIHRLPKRVKYNYDPSNPPEGMTIPVPIGYSRAGLEVADLVKFPHLLVGGTTGSGKSVFLHGLVYALLFNEKVQVKVIDLKRLEFIGYKDHTDYAPTLPEALRVIREVHTEMNRRMELFAAHKVNNIAKWKDPLPYVALVVDEFAELWPQRDAQPKKEYEMKKTAHSLLHSILSLARAVGIHCVISCQRPDRFILPGQLKGNLDATLAFRVRNKTAAGILDTPLSAYIPKEYPGRAIWNWQTEREVQCMYFEPEEHKLPPPRIEKKEIAADGVM